MPDAGLDTGSVGATSAPVHRAWTSTECLLYAVGIGAGQDPLDPTELQFVTENIDGLPQRVLPTFALVPGMAGLVEVRATIGTYDPAKLVLGEIEIELDGPLPPDGEVVTTTSIEAIYDKGSGALVVFRGVSTDPTTGERRFAIRSSQFIRDAGGWGGPRGPSAEPSPDATPPTHEVVSTVRPEQALIYRLSGDRNRLHADPTYAQRAGFPRPILHGMCTYGFAGRALLHALCDSDVARFAAIAGRLSSPVFTGSTLTTEIWQLGPGEARFRVRTEDERIAIDQGRFSFRP